MSCQLQPAWCLAWGKTQPSSDPPTFSIPDRISIYGRQPAFSPQRQLAIAGEIWLSDRASLLRRLAIAPRSWQGTDLELVARLWEKWGSECLEFLPGKFGFVVWDRHQQKLYLVRDRVGSYTLYYTTSGATRWVAPRLRTLLPRHSQELDLVALRDYLCCAFVPGERTLWRGVKEVRPGTVLCFPDATTHSVWEPTEAIVNRDQPLPWHSQQLRSLLDRVVQEYLPENEPVGVYLSGGLDSSSITALATKFHPFPVHTYSIHFGSQTPNELAFSSLVAEHCHTQHQILEITPQQMWEQLPVTMAHLDDPIGDPLTVPNYLLAQQAKHDVRVILNGEGGDPCFGGPKNQPMLLTQLYGTPATPSNLVKTYLNSFKKCAADLPQLLTPPVWSTVKDHPSVFAKDLASSAKYLNRLMMLNIKYKGADQILTKVNNLTQAGGLDGRSPLFDWRVVEMAMQIPPEYKLAGAEEKAVLKQAVADLLPEAIIKRPKSGMMVPVQLGFKKYWQRQARQLLLDKKAAIAPYLNQQPIQDWLNFRGDVWQRYGVKLWLLVSLEIWLQVNQKS